MRTLYTTTVISGVTDSLTAINGTYLNEGDIALVSVANVQYFYHRIIQLLL